MGGEGRSTGSSWVPHSTQKRAPSGTIAPHAGQRRSSGVPQFMQKRAPSGFSVPHAEQIGEAMSVHPTPGRGPWQQVVRVPAMPDFLKLPERQPKPRQRGLTHVIDSGLTTVQAEGLMASAADYIDLVRLGWGSAYVTHDVKDKIDRYRSAGVPVMLGGTLTELVWLRGQVEDLRSWLRELGIEHVEVSSGTLRIPSEEKLALIRDLASDFTVFAEVGEKDPDALMAPYVWVELIKEALEAGAQKVICEGRATGDAGLYRSNAEPRTGLIDEIVHEVDSSMLIFEAPQKHQQVRFIELLGPDVNLGNVLPDDVISLETLRVGLRADTLKHFHAPESE